MTDGDGARPSAEVNQCPECDGPTSERGMTFSHRDDVLWNDCMNCDWNSKGENNE